MAKSRSPWRTLRPALLAGAAALTWLTFSSTAASADTLPDASSLLSGVGSSVSTVLDKQLDSVPGLPSDSADARPAGLLQPVIGSVAGLTDGVIASTPVVQHVIPAGTVPALAGPVTGIADRATSTVIETVIPPVTATVPALEPVLDPVADLVKGETLLPVPVQVLPDAPVLTDSGVTAGPGLVDPNSGNPAKPDAEQAAPQPAQSASQEESSIEESAADAASPAFLPGGTHREVPVGAPTHGSPDSSRQALPVELPGSVGPSPRPGPVPAAPVTAGAGSSAPASSGSSGSAAWLNSFHYQPAFAAVYSGGVRPEHAPDPVSFDPGSSPD